LFWVARHAECSRLYDLLRSHTMTTRLSMRRRDARDRSGAADESQLAINLETVKSPASP